MEEEMNEQEIFLEDDTESNSDESLKLEDDDDTEEVVDDVVADEEVSEQTSTRIFGNVQLADDEVEVVSVDPFLPSRVNSLFPSSDHEVDEIDDTPLVVITHDEVPIVAVNKLKEKYKVSMIGKKDEQDVVLEKVCKANAIFFWGYRLKIDRELLDFMSDNLKVVGLMSEGYENVDVRQLVKRKIKISNTKSVLTNSIAEVALSLALAVAHRFREGYIACTKGQWVTGEPDWLLGKQLSGSICGIVGFGNIGLAIAKRLIPFSIKKIIYSGHGKILAERDGTVEFVEFEDLLAVSDFIFIACPLTEETKYMFDLDTFRMMKPTAIVVNVSKGAVIKTEALVKALRDRLIWGAGLDATDPEFLPYDHPLIHLDNCFVSPRIGSATLTTREAMAMLTADNIIAALENEPMPNEVCFKKDPKRSSKDSNLSTTYKPRRTLANHVLDISELIPPLNQTTE